MKNKHIVSILTGLLLGGTLLYPTFRPYLFFILMNGLVLINAGILCSNLNIASSWTARILGIYVLASVQITVTQLYPGLLGYLTFVNVISAQIVCLGITLMCVRLGWLRIPSRRACGRALSDLWRTAGTIAATDNRTILVCVLATAVFAFVFAVSALNPPISIDTLTFHFVEPVKWLQSGLIPTQLEPNFAYPYGLNLLTTWLIFPFHHDFIARLSQTPVVLLGALASYGICLQLDMRRSLSLVTALAVFTFPVYLANGITLTDPDTLMAGTLLVALYFAASLAQSYSSGTVVLLALSLGLLLGSKYNSLYYGIAIVWLVIYAWNKGRKTLGWSGGILFHGVILTLIPLAVGGATYLLYDYSKNLPLPFGDLQKGLTTGFSTLTSYNPFIQKFSLISFMTSPETLRNVGLTLFLGPIAIYGFLKLFLSGRRQEMILPGFVCLPILSSLGIYTLFGYYPGPEAMRHLLGTMALYVISGGWAISVLKEPNRSYGACALTGVIAISVVLGFVRQWPLHLLLTNFAAAGIALLLSIVVWWILVYIRSNGAMPGFFRTNVLSVPALLFISWLGILSLHGWEFLYRDYKYARWPPFFGFGTSWTWLANATAGHGARIAYNTLFYPIFGYDLKNTPVYIMPTLTRQDTPEERTRQLGIWEEQLHQSRIDFVWVFALGPAQKLPVSEHERYDILEEWMGGRPDVFTLIFKNDRELVYRLNRSSHIMTDPTGATL